MHLFASLILAVCSLCGIWQGTLQSPVGPLRRLMEITPLGSGISVKIHSVDETDVPLTTNNVTVWGSTLTMRFDMNSAPWIDYHRTYTATLVRGDRTMRGIWAGADVPNMKMTFAKVARATWALTLPTATHMVPVQNNVSVEVLDWGGTGRPVLLLAGLGNTAHDFFTIVPELKSRYHVYSMTRRGFGNSSAPRPIAANYSADRLGDDVLAVMKALDIRKPVLIGHSIAGEELSDIGTRDPQDIAGLVYLDAGFPYAFNDGTETPEPIGTPPPGAPPMPPAFFAILHDEGRTFRGPIHVPVLAIFADPHAMYGPQLKTRADVAKAEAEDKIEMDRIVAHFGKGLPNATVLTIPNASHYVYISNKAEVVHEINAFIDTLPKN